MVSLFLILAMIPPPGEKSTVSAVDANQARAFLTQTPASRIRQRNLFHPTRGQADPAKPGAAEEPDRGIPRLTGTLIQGTARAAMLLWPGSDEAQLLDLRASSHGLRLVKVETGRVELADEKTGATQWISLDEDPQEAGPGGSELEGLLKLHATAPMAPPPKGKP